MSTAEEVELVTLLRLVLCLCWSSCLLASIDPEGLSCVDLVLPVHTVYMISYTIKIDKTIIYMKVTFNYLSKLLFSLITKVWVNCTLNIK